MQFQPMTDQDAESLAQAIAASDRLYLKGVQEVGAAVWCSPAGEHFLLPPCGRCREVISDFNPDARILISSNLNHWDVDAIHHPVILRVGEMLPLKPNGLKVE